MQTVINYILFFLFFISGIFFKTAIDYIVKNKLKKIGKVNFYFVEYFLRYYIYNKGTATIVNQNDSPTMSEFELTFDIYNSTGTDIILRDFNVYLLMGKKKIITNEAIFSKNRLSHTFAFVTLTPSEQIRVYCRLHFPILDLVCITKNTKVIFTYHNGKKYKCVKLTELTYHNGKDGCKIML